MTYEDFKNEVLGKGLDVDGAFGIQCVDLYLYYCKRLGYPAAHCGATGYAQDLWTQRKTNGILNNFDEVELMNPGDVAIFKPVPGVTPLSHVAIFDSDAGNGYGWFLGQNQGGPGGSTNLVKLPYSATYDTAFRPKKYVVNSEIGIKNTVFPLSGADISEHQGGTFDQCKDLDFIIPRIAYGTNEDKYFKEYAKKYPEKIKGVYLFCYAINEEQVRSEAEFAVQTLQRYGLDVPVIFYDLEYATVEYAKSQGVTLTAAQIQKHTQIFTDRVRELGYQPGVYTNLDYWNTNYKGYSFKDCRIWFASYSDRLPVEETVVDIWQYSDAPYDQNRAKMDAFNPLKTIPKVIKQEASGSVYRLYNPTTSDHLYTINYSEAEQIHEAGWIYEGIGWIAPESGQSVFRLYNQQQGRHLYTMDQQEKDSLILNSDWKFEGCAFCSGGKEPIYRLYNPNSGAHLLTALREEHNALCQAGWYCEGEDIKAIG